MPHPPCLTRAPSLPSPVVLPSRLVHGFHFYICLVPFSVAGTLQHQQQQQPQQERASSSPRRGLEARMVLTQQPQQQRRQQQPR